MCGLLGHMHVLETLLVEDGAEVGREAEQPLARDGAGMTGACLTD